MSADDCSQRDRMGVLLRVKVVPGSSREGVAGWLGDELKLRVQAPPQQGKANDAVRNLLARTLECPVDRIRIIGGAASPHKRIEIDGLTEKTLREKLGRP